MQDPQINLATKVLQDFAELLDTKIADGYSTDIQLDNPWLWQSLEEGIQWCMAHLEPLHREDLDGLVLLNKLDQDSQRVICQLHIPIQIQAFDLDVWILRISAPNCNHLQGFHQILQLIISQVGIDDTKQFVLEIEMDLVQQSLGYHLDLLVGVAFIFQRCVLVQFDDTILNEV